MENLAAAKLLEQHKGYKLDSVTSCSSRNMRGKVVGYYNLITISNDKSRRTFIEWL
jgi:hypothetical protein